MLNKQLLVVPTGSANLASVRAAFTRAGCAVRMAETPEQIQSAELLVLPGVGAFGAARQRLHDEGFVEALRRRFLAGHPSLAICLGMQLLADSSQESPGERGLSLWPVEVRQLGDELPRPQIGWNRVTPESGDMLVPEGLAYFANSYALASIPPGWSASWTDYGVRFPSALERGAVLACQFHPELSGSWGAQLLQRWLERSSC